MQNAQPADPRRWRQGARELLAGKGAFWPLRVAAVALPLLAFALATGQSWRRVQTEAAAELVRRVELLQEHARRAFETQDALLAALQWQIRGMPWPQILADAPLAEMLAYLVRSTPGTGNLGLAAPDGQAALQGNPPGPARPVGLAGRAFLLRQRGPAPGPYVSPPMAGPAGGRPFFHYSRPRRDADGRPDGGALWTSFRPADFTAVYARLVGAAGDEVALLRREDGALLASYPSQPAAADAAAPPTLHAADGLAAALAAAGPVEGPSPFDGRTRRYLVRHLPDHPVSVVYGQNPEGPRALWRREALNSGMIAATAMLLLLWLTAVAQRRARGEAVALQRGQAEAERRAEAEAALRQTQRLEALGQIAAGVAHDFRNTVQAVRAGARLARKSLEAGDTRRAAELLEMVATAAGRGALLTDRMLRMARRGAQPRNAPAVLEPEAALRAAVELLRRTLPAGYPVTLEVDRRDLPPRVVGDPAELEAALLNLALNARDAMPRGGPIRVRLEGVPPGAPPPLGFGASQAQARISMADSGIGMDPATLARAAEPFFTTKQGHGTGLGLASVRAFAHGAGGAMQVTSEGPGRGCTILLWLPAAPGGGGELARVWTAAGLGLRPGWEAARPAGLPTGCTALAPGRASGGGCPGPWQRLPEAGTAARTTGPAAP
ncbi:ATP-binding protein [Siccirubricoccus phaeus]|uniref:ATP-binding protein n=1 Tax=Siccirubricoccus phaeus TaxID=2595053 RepID=UPI0011F2DA36|nr:ATP-binding protein [Siccirubricoccus phaeus]